MFFIVREETPFNQQCMRYFDVNEKWKHDDITKEKGEGCLEKCLTYGMTK